MFASFCIGIIVVLVYFLYFYQDRRTKNLIEKIPGPVALPVIGNVHQFDFGHAWFNKLLQWSATYRKPGIYRLWLMNRPLVIIHEAKYVEALLSSTKHIDKAPEYDFLLPWLRTGLLTSTGNKWRVRRKMLTPTFHFNILNDFMFVFNKQADILVTKLEGKSSHGPFNVFQDIALCALDIICESAMGQSMGAQGTDSEYVNGIYRISTILDERTRKPYFWNDVIYRLIGPGKEHDQIIALMHKFTKKVILDRLETFDNEKSEKVRHELAGEEDGAPRKGRLAFLDLLLSMSDNLTTLTLTDIQEEVDTFMFEGHDTTAAAINWATHLIGANPDVQEKVYEELVRVFGSGTESRDVTSEDLKDLKYLECCIKEALRIFPSVPMFGRQINEDLDLGDFTIPSGSTVYVQTTCLHRDPEVFPDPDQFKPERFLLESSKLRHPYSYIPFSAGPRNCIGQKFALMEEKVVLAHIFRKFRVKSTQQRGDLRPVGEIILRPEQGIQVQLTPRDQSL